MKRKAGWLIVFFLLLLAECTLTDAASAAAINNSRNAASARKPPPAPKRLEHQAAQHDTHMAATPLVTLGYLILLRLCPGTVFPLVGSLYLKMALAAACTTAELPWGRIMCKVVPTGCPQCTVSYDIMLLSPTNQSLSPPLFQNVSTPLDPSLHWDKDPFPLDLWI